MHAQRDTYKSDSTVCSHIFGKVHQQVCQPFVGNLNPFYTRNRRQTCNISSMSDNAAPFAKPALKLPQYIQFAMYMLAHNCHANMSKQ